MKTLRSFILLTIPVFVLSCSNGTNNNKNRNNDQNNRNMQNNQRDQSNPNRGRDTVSQGSFMFSLHSKVQNDDDKDFVKEAAIGGQMEVQAGRLAQERATNPRVKKFGSMMVRDHTKANEELRALATSKNIDVPSALDNKHQKNVDDLESQNGNDFDKTYMKQMVEDHKEDVELFRKQSDEAKDPSIKSFASKTLPVLEMHLDSAMAIQKGLK